MSAPDDIYVLAADRSIETVTKFLETFAQERVWTQDEYEVPQCASLRQHTFYSAEDVIEYCVKHPNEPYALHCMVDEAEIGHAILIFSDDAGLLLGIESFEEVARDRLAALMVLAQSDVGCVWGPTLPPLNSAEFSAIIRGK